MTIESVHTSEGNRAAGEIDQFPPSVRIRMLQAVRRLADVYAASAPPEQQELPLVVPSVSDPDVIVLSERRNRAG